VSRSLVRLPRQYRPVAPTSADPDAADRPVPREFPTRAVLRTAAALAVLFLLFIGATLAIVVFPPTDRPARADAILMLGGAGDRRGRALDLARAGYAPVLALSTPNTKDCPTVPHVKVICFRPDPFTTQGEAREAGQLAAQYGWTRMIFITDRSQNVRARLRIDRCYDGKKIMISVNPPFHDWPYLITYQWSAMFKALVLQRGC
jgi:hypothetical protein